MKNRTKKEKSPIQTRKLSLVEGHKQLFERESIDGNMILTAGGNMNQLMHIRCQNCQNTEEIENRFQINSWGHVSLQ
jgi:hypothetical protein